MTRATVQSSAARFSMLERARFVLRRKLVKRVRVTDGEHQFSFRCESLTDVGRAKTLLEKESGTVEWIRTEVKPGDVFYDIGANMGIYTLLAGVRVGPGGKVYAFEPHVVNVHTLLHNVQANGLEALVDVLSCALNDREGFFDFNYYSEISGSSNSQLNDTRDGTDLEFRPVFKERKQATTVDALTQKGVIRPADHVKIDVDGNEMLILRGMSQLFAGARPPKSVQVEVNARYRTELFDFMRAHGFEVATRHHTWDGKRRIAAGTDPESISYNAVFKRSGPARER
jgi:FkbM family methyltransferase